jgi:proline iminopeptidase
MSVTIGTARRHERTPVRAPDLERPPGPGDSGDGSWSPAAAARTLLDAIWRDHRLGLATALALTAGWAVVAGWWMPRGPLTTSQALASIVLSLAVGLAAGTTARTRWMMLAAPVLFAGVFELMRLGLDGPTVDAPHLSTYGLLAMAVGRGFHGLVSLLPMVWGAAMGVGVAHRLDPAGAPPARSGRLRRLARIGRRSVAILAGVGLAAFAVLLARPASTTAITGPDGEPVPDSIAELTTLEVNGHELAMMIRGHSVDNPVLLFLAGGPGGSEMGAMRNHLPALEEHFTVVTWDQRGTGKSYPDLDPTGTISLDGFVADTLVVTDHLRERFGQDRIYLLGQSWGSTLGVLAVQEAPERYAAIIGTGQMVSQLGTDRIFYEDTLAWAEANDNGDLAGRLRDIGPPPYGSMLDYETALSHEHEVYPYDRSGNSEGMGGFSENFFVPEYTLVEQVHLLGGFMDTFAALYPQLQDIDFRETATELDVPAYFVQGAHEAAGRAEPFDEWYPMLEAPAKDLVVLDTSGHRPLFEQPDEFVDYMVDTVLAETQGS